MVFQCINIRQVPREVLKTAASGPGFQHLPRDLANVNAWKIMFDPYNDMLYKAGRAPLLKVDFWLKSKLKNKKRTNIINSYYMEIWTNNLYGLFILMTRTCIVRVCLQVDLKHSQVKTKQLAINHHCSEYFV